MKIKTTLTVAALFAATFILRAGEPVRFTAAQASVTIRGTSSLHEWQMKGTTIGGEIAADPEAWQTEGPKSAAARVAIPVASIRSEHDRMDRIMRDALKAKEHPEIRYDLTTASLVKTNGDSFIVRTGGKLSIAGVTRDVVLDVTVQHSGARRYVLTAETPLRMSDYGIKPPVAMLGTLKTGDDITVSFRWTVDRSQG